MVFGTVFDTAIGLVLIFLLFSVLLTILMEIVSGALGLRGKALEDAIAKLIEDPQVQGAARAAGMFGAHRLTAAAAPVLSYKAVYNHPMVAGISGTDKPSYVPGANFASALVQCLGSMAGGVSFANVQAAVATLPAGDLRTALETLLSEAQGDMDKLRDGIARWYDSAMDRLSGSYKRFTQVFTFVAGLILAVAFNVDAITIGHQLYNDPAARAAMTAAAEKQVQAGLPAKPGGDLSELQKLFQEARAQLDATNLVGWGPNGPNFKSVELWVGVGWLLTALAGLMGAPFWFDALKGIVNVRNSGPKPSSSTSDAS
jgi:hypothetical protein